MWRAKATKTKANKTLMNYHVYKYTYIARAISMQVRHLAVERELAPGINTCCLLLLLMNSQFSQLSVPKRFNSPCAYFRYCCIEHQSVSKDHPRTALRTKPVL